MNGEQVEQGPGPGAEQGDSPELAEVVQRNIRVLLAIRKRFENRRNLQEHAVDAITGFIGSPASVYLHVFLLGSWILLNLHPLPRIPAWDRAPFPLLSTLACIEAIFLSMFVLMTQNRMNHLSRQREDLDLQVGLLAEHEVTRLIEMVDEISRHLGLRRQQDPQVEQLKRDVPPEAVLLRIEEAEAELESDSAVEQLSQLKAA